MNIAAAGVAAPASYRGLQFRVLAATWLGYFGLYFCRKSFFVVKADLESDLHLTATGVAHLVTAYLVAYSVGQFSSAFIGQKIGGKLLLLIGTSLSVLCNVVFGATNSYATVMLFMTLNGLAQGMGWPACIGSLAYWFRRTERGQVLGWWATCYQVGSLVSAFFAAYLLGLWGWRSSFFGGSLVLLAIWFIILLTHPGTPQSQGLQPLDDEEDEQAPQGDERTGLGWDRQVIASVMLMGTIYFCIKFLRYALWSWAPYFMRNSFALAGDDAGYLSTAFDLAGFVGVVFAGYVSDKVFGGRRSGVSFAMLVAMLGGFVAMVVWGPASVVAFTLTMAVVGFCLFGPDSLLSGVGAIDVGSQRGALAAAGMINGMGAVGAVFQEEVIGWLLADGQGIESVFVLFAGTAGVAALLSLRLWRVAAHGKSKF